MLAKYQIKYAIMTGQPHPSERKEGSTSSRRFETTTLFGTESVASRLDEVPDRTQVAKDLRERKLRNGKTSIVMGSSKVLYETDAVRRQRDILGAPPRGPDEKRNKDLKQALTRTHFVFGDEEVDYGRSSTLPDPTGRLHEYTGVLNSEVKSMIKSTSLSFGNADTDYKSMAHEQMDLKVPEGEIRGPDVEKNRKLKVALTRTHFNFGEEDMDYTTDYQRGFVYDQEKVKSAGQAALAKEVKDDLRRTHFSFGNDTGDWQTDSMCTQTHVAEKVEQSRGVEYKAFLKGQGSTGPEERKVQTAKNKALKKQLQSTNYEIGTDEEYM